ncbi:MAG TPA: helix-turn-helix domain-containing protein [Luteibacter sp.]|uniref:helix-turn-helix domain-containing protein n=1 Tax=Luteibacter sp. TaxID=1886636 RepID=UPI002D189408|nr:helix-turn-helix domain-containing protein [Luteibacter sp.]HVI53442.1 helix-turn-helix domain-containing protein [Luteibacter sp.]
MSTQPHDVSAFPPPPDAGKAGRLFWQDFFRGQGVSTMLDGYAGERLRLATFRHRPHVLTGDGLARTHRGAALLSHHLEGGAAVEQHGRQEEIVAGDFCLIDLSRPFRLQMGTATVQVVYMPLATLREVMPRLDQLSAVCLPGNLGAVGYLRVLLGEMFAHTCDLTEAVADRLADAIPHMLAAAFASRGRTEPSPSQLRYQYKQQVRRFAKDHLADPALCVEMIGLGVGLSPSYIFELFADESLTLMRWVRAERLARCRRELADPALRHRSIAQVAQSWGFGDMTHFSRSFREIFGVSPRGYRQASLDGDPMKQLLSAVHTSD